jgi:hypothetical protein
MFAGSRITDAVEFYRHRGELPGAVAVVRRRPPERFRWRNAIFGVTASAAVLHGKARLRVEEPIREVVLDLSDPMLRREVVLDARRNGVDLDRGEVLPRRTLGDLWRVSFLVGADMRTIQQYVQLPTHYDEAIDTGGVILIGRALSQAHRRRAQQLWLELPPTYDARSPLLCHQYLVQRAERNAEHAKRWGALSKALLDRV